MKTLHRIRHGYNLNSRKRFFFSFKNFKSARVWIYYVHAVWRPAGTVHCVHMSRIRLFCKSREEDSFLLDSTPVCFLYFLFVIHNVSNAKHLNSFNYKKKMIKFHTNPCIYFGVLRYSWPITCKRLYCCVSPYA